MADAPVTFQRATRRATKLKLSIAGPSGSGKTKGALALARGLAKGGKIAVIDTENGSAALYADEFEFDALEISPKYLTTKYEAAVQAAIAGGYAVLVIDSISHQWEGEGGILQRKEETDARGGNHFSNWEPFTKEHNRFRALLLHSPIHIIATMRSKMAYAQEENGKKTSIKKLGLQPIQRDGMEYEFAISFDVQMDHKAAASKDRTGLFKDELVDLCSPAVAARLLSWLETAAPEEPKAAPPVEPQKDKMVVTLDSVIPFGPFEGKTVKEAGLNYFEELIGKLDPKRSPKSKAFVDAAVEAFTEALDDDQTGDAAEPAEASLFAKEPA